jgi:ferredoxin
MKATVDAEACIGCALCVSICDTVFAMDENGKAKAVVDRVGAENKDQCRQAAKDCPVEAIKIDE